MARHMTRIFTCKTFQNILGCHYSTKPHLFKDMSLPTVHHSVQTVLNILNDKKFEHNVAVQELLKIYNVECEPQFKGSRKYPFIVFEGIDATGKTTVSRKLADSIRAELLVTPPVCIQHIRHLFDEDLLMRSAYYAMGNYIANAQIKKILEVKPVVLDRFWHSTTAYVLAESVRQDVIDELPEKQDIIYRWPCDLLKPDIILYLTVSEEERQRRQNQRGEVTKQEQNLKNSKFFRNNIYVAYSNMADTNFQIVDSSKSVEDVLEDLKEKINYLL